MKAIDKAIDWLETNAKYDIQVEMLNDLKVARAETINCKLQLVDHKEVEHIECEDVQEEDLEQIISEWLPDMITIGKAHNALGVAAPQVGIKKNFYIARVDGEFELFLNASYIKGNASRDTHLEGCLSYLGVPQAKVKRWKEIILNYQQVVNSKLVRMRKKFRGIEAFEHQHEIQHLKGKTVYNQ